MAKRRASRQFFTVILNQGRSDQAPQREKTGFSTSKESPRYGAILLRSK
jgi:hypothetical protein